MPELKVVDVLPSCQIKTCPSSCKPPKVREYCSQPITPMAPHVAYFHFKTLGANQRLLASAVRNPYGEAERVLFSFTGKNDLKNWNVFSDSEHGGSTSAALAMSADHPARTTACVCMSTTGPCACSTCGLQSLLCILNFIL